MVVLLKDAEISRTGRVSKKELLKENETLTTINDNNMMDAFSRLKKKKILACFLMCLVV